MKVFRFFSLLGLTTLLAWPIVASARTLPVKDWLRPPQYTKVALSPDGKYLAAVMTATKTGNRYEVAVMKTAPLLAGKVKVAARMGFANGELLGECFWINNDRLVLATERYYGGFDRPYFDGNLYSVSAHGGRQLLLMGARAGNHIGSHIPSSGVHAYFAGMISRLPAKKNLILVKGYRENSDKPAAYRINAATGSTFRIANAPANGGMLADHTGTIRIEWGYNEKTGQPKLRYRPEGSMDWKDISSLVQTKASASAPLEIGGPVMFGRNNKGVYFENWASNAAKTNGLYFYNIATGAKKPIYANPNVDVGDIIKSFDRKSVVGIRIYPGKPKTLALDPKAPRIQLLAALSQALPNVQADIVSWSRDGRKAIIRTWGDTVSPTYYLYTSAPKPKLTPLFNEMPWIKADDLSEMKPISFKSRDGLRIHGYLTLPRGAATRSLPMVVYVHGGPYGIRTYWGFNPMNFSSVAEQILANHGYAVLSINYRGSGGYGLKFLTAGIRHWGDTMQNDLADGVAWTVKRGYADPKRVCIFGASYGGYASLMSAERFPDLFQCAVGYDGVYDLALEETRSSDTGRYAFGRLYMKAALGHDPKELRAFSPAFNADKLKIPVFLLHGGRDVRAPVEGYDEMVAAIKKHGTPLKILYYKNEGHTFYQLAHREKAWEDILAFLDRYIGSGTTTSSDVRTGPH